MRNILCVLCCFVALSTSIVQGGIVSLSGDVEMIAPPFSVQEGAVESDSVARLFLEREGFALPSDLDVDITTPGGVFDEFADLVSPGSISAGTMVNSYFFHADAVDTSVQVYDGEIVFSEPILGIILTHDTLQASHPIVGAPSTTTTYPANGSTDASDAPFNLFNSGDSEMTVMLPSTVIFHSSKDFSNNTYDHFRVITAVPEPSSVAILAIGGALIIGITLCRRRRSAGGARF